VLHSHANIVANDRRIAPNLYRHCASFRLTFVEQIAEKSRILVIDRIRDRLQRLIARLQHLRRLV
jgi:hypothetical protein